LKKAGIPYYNRGLPESQGGTPAMHISYKEAYNMNREEARKQLINTYSSLGNTSMVAWLWHTSRNVVRKWMRRF